MNTTTQIRTVKVIFYDTLISKNRSDWCPIELHGVGAFGLRTCTLLRHELAAASQGWHRRSIVNGTPRRALFWDKCDRRINAGQRAIWHRTGSADRVVWAPSAARSNLVRGTAPLFGDHALDRAAGPAHSS